MKKAVLVTSLGCWILNSLFPWWSLCFATAFAGLFHRSLGRAVGFGFLSATLLWGGYPLFLHLTGHGVLAPRLALTFGVQYWPVLILASGLIGGVLGALGGWVGFAFKRVISQQRRVS